MLLPASHLAPLAPLAGVAEPEVVPAVVVNVHDAYAAPVEPRGEAGLVRQLRDEVLDPVPVPLERRRPGDSPPFRKAPVLRMPAHAT